MEMEELVQKKLRLVFNDDSIIFDKSRFAGGLTNYNYFMNIKGTEYVVRQPGGMTNKMIDRKIEKINNLMASEFGLNCDCVYFDDVSGIKISVCIKNSKNIALIDPCCIANLRAVSGLLKKTHSSPKNFPNSFDWQTELNKYEQIIQDLNGGFFFDYSTLKKELVDFMQKNIKNTISVPCHNDTVPENFVVDDNGRTYLVDWEYSGMNDPSWDVAAYILESRLTEEAIQYFLLDYYGQFLTPGEILKIKCYMVAQDLLWMVWAMIRHYSGDDFLDYCSARYERFQKNVKAITVSGDCSIADMVKN
ncbi:phosphotransferase family protein [Clostridium tagluense]|uniref:phosphotransferase n=1 Tax=Clostridium TaxID=1485 RepID=UPI0013E94491|nr:MULTISPECIES: choline/ethanolamine kinase family protein [Clostridium]MBU3128276.1 phosphotransferase family protein [Clostridium tagluense]MBW9157666.1 phosphotransferase family protein [Clostridium tagluense]MBZ9622747.1 phosphotransferase family protein [Clostridium sp. FP2]MCB2310761.1 phosphotransferase family protein [Clostridium tagluense]MCB2315509.1 phosphotransferase family protein [Clostridium tagluense]